jgi:hypothetical protein
MGRGKKVPDARDILFKRRLYRVKPGTFYQMLSIITTHLPPPLGGTGSPGQMAAAGMPLFSLLSAAGG